MCSNPGRVLGIYVSVSFIYMSLSLILMFFFLAFHKYVQYNYIVKPRKPITESNIGIPSSSDQYCFGVFLANLVKPNSCTWQLLAR
jgi:hypothetical protein